MGVTTEEFAKNIGKYYDVLKELYPDEECNLTELAFRLGGKSLSNTSSLVKRLKKRELLETREVKREGGRAFKYIKLATGAREVIASMVEATRPKPEKPKDVERADRERVLLTLKALDPNIQNENVREELASRFSALKKYRVWDYEEVREVFKQMMLKPKDWSEGVKEKFFRSFCSLMGWMLQDANAWEWISKNLYPEIVNHAKDRHLNDEMRRNFLRLLEDVFHFIPEKREEILNISLELFFKEEVRKDSDLYYRVKRIITERCIEDGFKTNETFDKLLEKTHSSEPTIRERAEDLIKPYIRELTQPPGETRETTVSVLI